MIKQLQGVDIVKYVMAFAVVAIHCAGPYPVWFEWVIREAVPFFFVTSGFLLARELAQKGTAEFLHVRVRKIFRLYGMWLLIYVPLAVAGYLLTGTPVWKIPLLMVATALLKGEILYAWPLWFLYSLGIGTFAVSLILRNPRIKPLVVGVIAICYVAYAYEMHGAFGLGWLPVRAIGGAAYLLLGMGVYRHIERLKSPGVIAGSFAVSLLLIYAGQPFYEIFGGVGLFITAYSLPVRNRESLCMELREQSMWVYYLHMYPVFLLLRLPAILGHDVSFWPAFALIMGIMATLAALLTRLGSRCPTLRTLIK